MSYKTMITDSNNKSIKNEYGRMIRDKRIKLNMTQKELSDAIGLTKCGDRTVRRWENQESFPSVLELDRILSFPEIPPFKDKGELKYKMIDLFAGIGGIRLGFQLHGLASTVFSSEWDKYSQKTYLANFGVIPEGDITKISESEIPDHDILIAGFPCQAFSQAGLKKGFEDTRGTLFFDIVRILKKKKPNVFLLENVKNLRGHDNGKTFKVIISTLEKLGYKVYAKTFKARDFGVPQNRERIYIVGFDKKKIRNANDFSFPIVLNKKTKVGNILEKNVDDKYTISDKLWEGHKRRKELHVTKGNGFGYSLVNSESEYTNTLSARYYKDGSEILIEQNKKNPRKITPREASRLQGFPAQFIIPVSDTQAYKQFGNSVCVPVIYAIAKEIFVILENSKK